MNPGRRLGLWMAAVLLVALGAGVVLHATATRAALQEQLDERNRSTATTLASLMSHTASGAAGRAAVAAAQFSHGDTLRLCLRQADGSVIVDLHRVAQTSRAPTWFVALLPLRASPGQALVEQTPGPAAELQFEADPAWAHDTLWASCLRAALWAAALALGALALGGCAARRWLAQGPAAPTPPPAGPPASAPAAAADMQQLRAAFAEQAEQVAQLQRQAQLDNVTALPLRRHFLGLLQQRLAEPGGPGLALLLVRVLQLDGLNQRLGFEATDHVLGAVAGVLLTYVDRVPGTFAGRLNGSDFALCLPVPGVARETAASLRTALAAAPALRSAGAELVVGGVDGVHDTSASAALATADAALAQAEAGAATAAQAAVVDMRGAADGATHGATGGARTWREQITSALAEGRTALAATPLLDRQGHEIHLECSLRVQMQAGGVFQATERWLALARRSRLMPQVDLAALDLALQAIAQDGRARAVHASPLSLELPGFVAEVASCLAAAPVAARRLTIECVDGMRPGASPTLLAAAVSAWQPWGVSVGVEHAAYSAQQLPALQAAGVRHVKVDLRQLQGLAGDGAVQDYARGLLSLLHGLGLRVLAVGVANNTELAVLWALGFDGASAPAEPTGS